MLFRSERGDHRDLHNTGHSFPTRRSSDLRALALYVDHPAARILDDRLLAGAARELLFVLQLEARQPVAVRADEPEDLRRHRSLRVGAVLLGIEAEPRELQPLQRGGLCGVRLAGDVDKAVRTVGEIGRASCRERVSSVV